MRCLLIYDISDDKTRAKVADTCLDYGLDRVQYSAFQGRLSRNLQEELFLKITAIIGRESCHVQLLPICATDWANARVLDQTLESSHAR